MIFERVSESLSRRAEIENAVANAQNAMENNNDVSDALVELADMIAAQDDAIVELAEMIIGMEV